MEQSDRLIGALVAGRYRVVDRLGAGGMGTVYTVAHIAMDRRFAMKVVHHQLAADEEAVERFRREAIAGGQLTHANCVAIHDFGVVDGSLYLVMDLVRGRSLGDVLYEEGRLPWKRALRITRHLLRGLGHAHARGVIHRDLKPENIFIECRTNDPDFAKLLDFGIAKLVGRGVPALTQEGATLGTPEYLAPEQALGGRIDARTDLYTLSVVLYEMLAGKSPFAGLDELTMLTAHTSADVPYFSEVTPDVEIPAAVEALVRRGLAKRPGDRPGSADAYIVAIDKLLDATPAPAIPPNKKTGAGVRIWVPGIAVGLLAAIVAVVALGREGAPGHRDERLEALVHDLSAGSTCKARLAAVEALRTLGDPRAIPALRRARHRMRGGLLGVGENNTNRCLAAAAKAAIAELEATPDRADH